MKKILALILTVALCTGLLAGCGNTAPTTDKKDDKIKIVTTIYPEYDWVKQVLGDKSDQADIALLLDNGVDVHSYQPTTDDLMKISDCDLFIYVGGESDEWVKDALAQSKNKEMKVINLLEVLGNDVKDEEVIEGMQAEHDHDGDEHDKDHEHEHDANEAEQDEHVWLSLKNAQKVVSAIKDALAEIDADNKAVYEKNATDYVAALEQLDKEYQEVVKNAPQKTLLFGDRFPFRYLVDDYGLQYYAAFIGCSAETEASFETINFLAKKVDELKLKNILVIENSDKKIAETIKNNTTAKDQKILTLHSLQSITSKDAEKEMSYLSVMKDNLTVLKEALA